MAKKIYNSIEQLIGNTPLLKLNNIKQKSITIQKGTIIITAITPPSENSPTSEYIVNPREYPLTIR